MSGAHGSLLLDTCVWLDYYLGNRPGSNDARALIDAVTKTGIDLLYAVTSIKDVYFLVCASVKRQVRQHSGGELTEEDAACAESLAWGIVGNMEENATAVGLDVSDVWVASKQRPLHKDFEDNLVVAAAMRSKASCLVTNDAALRQQCCVLAKSCAEAGAMVESGVWG